MPKAFSKATRHAVIKAYSDGMSYRKIAERFKLKADTAARWISACGVTKNSRLSDSEIDKLMEDWGAPLRESPKGEDELGKARRARNNMHKFGKTTEEKQHALSLFKDLADPDDCQAAFEEYFRQVAAKLDRETTMEGQINAMTAAIVLVQLRAAIADCPKIASWGDFKTANDILRKSMGMDNKEESTSRGVDLRIINGTIAKGKVIDAKTA